MWWEVASTQGMAKCSQVYFTKDIYCKKIIGFKITQPGVEMTRYQTQEYHNQK